MLVYKQGEHPIGPHRLRCTVSIHARHLRQLGACGRVFAWPSLLEKRRPPEASQTPLSSDPALQSPVCNFLTDLTVAHSAVLCSATNLAANSAWLASNGEFSAHQARIFTSHLQTSFAVNCSLVSANPVPEPWIPSPVGANLPPSTRFDRGSAPHVTSRHNWGHNAHNFRDQVTCQIGFLGLASSITPRASSHLTQLG